MEPSSWSSEDSMSFHNSSTSSDTRCFRYELTVFASWSRVGSTLGFDSTSSFAWFKNFWKEKRNAHPIYPALHLPWNLNGWLWKSQIGIESRVATNDHDLIGFRVSFPLPSALYAYENLEHSLSYRISNEIVAVVWLQFSGGIKFPLLAKGRA